MGWVGLIRKLSESELGSCSRGVRNYLATGYCKQTVQCIVLLNCNVYLLICRRVSACQGMTALLGQGCRMPDGEETDVCGPVMQ
jgi:hypothetical protein